MSRRLPVNVDQLMNKKQGASRGIGLQFCKSLIARRNTQVIATCRNPHQALDLQKLQNEHPSNLHIIPLDITNEDDISQAASQVTDRFGKLDLLINSAGILHPSGRGETSLKAVSADDLMKTFSVNTIGPLLMAKHFSPLLVKGDGSFGKKSSDRQNAHSSILVNMSAKVGSITDNALGGWYSYRMSKAALNMVTKNLSIEFGRGHKKIISISLHPGTVDTALSRPYHKNVKNLFSLEQSVGYMMGVIESLSINDSGKFLLYDGSIMPS